MQADATKLEELSALARSTKLLLNCVGPYRFTGEAVVAACVDAATDYLDVSGEPGEALIDSLSETPFLPYKEEDLHREYICKPICQQL